MSASAHDNKRSVSGLLLKEMQQGATVQSIMDRVFDIWYYPTLFLDMSSNIDYYSRYSSEYDPWSALFHNGSLSHKYLDGPIATVLSKKNHLIKEDRLDVFSVDGKTYLLALVNCSNAPMGFLLMYCSNSKSEAEAKEVCSDLSETISFLIGKDPAAVLSDFDYTRNYIARKLLQFDERMGNASPDAGSVEYSASPLWPRIKPHYRIAAVSVEDSESGKLKTVDKDICQAYPDSYSLIKANTLYLFFYDLDDAHSKAETEMKNCLEKAAGNNSVSIALSSRFSDINQRQVFRRQAGDLSRMNSPLQASNGVLYADDNYPEQMLHTSKKRIGGETLMLSELVYLRDYDMSNGTEYLKTLCCYLRCNGTVRSAASQLHLEPKSLRYRIDKICGILNRSREDLLSDNALLLSSIGSCPVITNTGRNE